MILNIASFYLPHRNRKKLGEMLLPASQSNFGRDRTSISHRIQSIATRIVRPRSENTNIRRQQLNEMLTDAENAEFVKADRLANRHVATSFGYVVLAAGSMVFYPPLVLLCLPAILHRGVIYTKGAYKSITERGELNVDALLALLYVVGLSGGLYLPVCIANFVHVVSRKLMLRIRHDSHKNLIDVFRQQPDFVWVLVDDTEIQKPLKQLQKEDIVVVYAGEIIPVDGKILEGAATVDQHILTGESQVAEKVVNDEVLASTVVVSGRICIQIERAGDETTVAQIGRILNQTIDFKANTQLKAEQLANKTVGPTILASLLALPPLGFYGASALLCAHFKNKMSVIGPVGVLNYLNLASQQGVLIKDGRTLDLLNEIDTIVFDKTGTLTETQPHVGLIHQCTTFEEEVILRYAAAAEYRQTHPIAKAILQEAAQRGLALPNSEETEYQLGLGLIVHIQEQTEEHIVAVGSLRFMHSQKLEVPHTIVEVAESCYQQGHSIVIVALNDQIIGAIELHATVRPEAIEIINGLKARGIQTIAIISGDHEVPTRQLAHHLGVDHYFAEVMPQDKAQIIKELQVEGKSVCFIGDGINDAIALRQANASISLRGASTVATDAAQIILMHGDLRQLLAIFSLTHKFDQTITSSFQVILLVSLFSAVGALFFHFGLTTVVILNQFGLIGGLSVVMRPMLSNSGNETQQGGKHG